MSELVFDVRAVAPSPPDVGEVSIYVTDSPKFMKEDGVEKSFESVYGANYIGENSIGADTNTINSFKTYLGFSYPAGLAIAGYKYEIDFCSTIRYSTTGRNHINRVAIDGNTLEQELQYEIKDTGSDIREPIGYKYIVDGSQLNNAGGFVDYDFRAQNNGDTARVYSATLTFKRVL